MLSLFEQQVVLFTEILLINLCVHLALMAFQKGAWAVCIITRSRQKYEKYIDFGTCLAWNFFVFYCALISVLSFSWTFPICFVGSLVYAVFIKDLDVQFDLVISEEEDATRQGKILAAQIDRVLDS